MSHLVRYTVEGGVLSSISIEGVSKQFIETVELSIRVLGDRVAISETRPAVGSNIRDVKSVPVSTWLSEGF